MQPFDEMFQKFFEQTEFPNPFDPEGFGRFLQEQIKNALPNNTMPNNAMPNNAGSSNQAGLMPLGPRTSNQYPAPPEFGRSRLPNMANTRPNRKGTTSGLGRPPISQPAQPNQATPAQPEQEQGLPYQAFETHDELIIRVQIQGDPNLKPEKIKLTSYQLTFSGEKRNKPLLQIQLPKAVDPEKTKLGYRQGILEVKLAKRLDEPMTEIDVSNVLNSSDES